MNEGRLNQESEGTSGLIKDKVDVNKTLVYYRPYAIARRRSSYNTKTSSERGHGTGSEDMELAIGALAGEHSGVAATPEPLCPPHSLQTMEHIHVLPELPCNLARVPPLKQAWFLFHRDGKESVAFNPEDANRKIGWWCATPCPKHGHRYVPTLSAKSS